MTTKKQAAQALGAGDGLVAEAGAVDSARKAPALEPFDWRQHTTVEHDEHKDDVAAYLGRNPDVVAFLAMLRESVARHYGPAALVLRWYGHKPGGADVWEGLPDILVEVVDTSSGSRAKRRGSDDVWLDVASAQTMQPQLYDKIEVAPW